MTHGFTLSDTAIPFLYHEETARAAVHGFFGKPLKAFPQDAPKDHCEPFFAAAPIAAGYRESGEAIYGARFPKAAAHLKQVHGDRVMTVRAGDTLPAARDGDAADALVTDMPGLLLSVKTADCLPGLLIADNGRAVGAFHAGWRGACKNVAGACVHALRELAGRDAEITALIGPCIRPASFEVQEDFIAAVAETGVEPELYLRKTLCDRAETERLFFDLPGLVKDSLAEAGVPAGNIFDGGIDTFPPGSGYFSYRRMCKEETEYRFHNYAVVACGGV